MSKNVEQNLKDIPFEKALEELENLVDSMEEGDLPLDEMIKCFERGTLLSKHCRKKLSALEKKIEVLVKDNGEGGEWQDFDDSSERKQASNNDSSNGELLF
jgi:exodeoxyribonuclease VII small subunit